jgi:hypothetical protein
LNISAEYKDKMQKLSFREKEFIGGVQYVLKSLADIKVSIIREVSVL